MHDDEMMLLDRAKILNMDALSEIHHHYYGPIFRYIAFRVSDRETAEDLTSEVFTRLLSALRDHKAPQNTLRGWLYGVASNVVNDHHRKRYRAPQTALSESLAGNEVDPGEMVERMLNHDNLRAAITQLTEDQQAVLALRFMQGESIQETAHLMGKNEGAIKQLQVRALATLARKLSAWNKDDEL